MPNGSGSSSGSGSFGSGSLGSGSLGSGSIGSGSIGSGSIGSGSHVCAPVGRRFARQTGFKQIQVQLRIG